MGKKLNINCFRKVAGIKSLFSGFPDSLEYSALSSVLPGIKIPCSIGIIISILLLGTVCIKAQTFPLKVGVSRISITPPVGYPHYEGVSTGIKDSLYASAIVFRQGDIQGAILVCNLISIPRDLSRIVRELASKETGIPFQYISISVTHIHTGPAFIEPLKAYLEREASGKLMEEDHKGYIAFLIKGMTMAISTANTQVKEVVMRTGIGSATGISFNRRFLMTDGRVRMNPGRMNPKIVRPTGPVDPRVHFALFRPVDATLYSSCLSVFGSHYARGTSDFSADYPHYIQEYLKRIFGKQIVSVFGMGPSGDINTIDVSRKNDDVVGMEWVEFVGKKIADAINEALPGSEQRNPELAVASKTLYFPLQDFTSEELQWAKRDPKDPTLLYPDSPSVVKFRRGKILSLEELRQREAIPPSVSGEPWMLPVEIQVFKLDEQTAIITMPGGFFAELGIDLKTRSPFANTIFIEQANAVTGYIPPIRAFAEGQYEVLDTRLAPGSGEKMVEEALQMLHNIKIP